MGAFLVGVGAILTRRNSRAPPGPGRVGGGGGGGGALIDRMMIIPILVPIATSTLLHAMTVVSANWRMRQPVEPLILLLAVHGIFVVLGRISPALGPDPED